MALSLGLASDGSGLEALQVADAEGGKRRAPKRKEKESGGGPDDDFAPKRARRAEQHVHAPSPLSNELARGPGSPPATTSVPSRKRKAETPVRDDDAFAAALVASPPTRTPKSKSHKAKPKAKPAPKEKEKEPSPAAPAESEEPRKRLRSNSSTLSTLSADDKEKEKEKEPLVVVKTEKEKTAEVEEAVIEDEEDEAETPLMRPINIFVEPPELKPRCVVIHLPLAADVLTSVISF